MKAAVFTNKLKDTDYAVTKQVEKLLTDNNCGQIILDLDCEGFECSELSTCDFAVSIGGDGTLLQAAKYAIAYDIPITGINLGRTGFLAPIEKENFQNKLIAVIQKRYKIDKRVMIELYDEDNQSLGYAINDIIFKHYIGAGVGNFKVYIDDSLVSEYNGDGVLIAAPTGSTAYSLSLGGPIINPSCNLMIIQPIAPHSLNSRSIIVNMDEKISVSFNHDDTIISVDGQKTESVGSNLLVKKSESYCSFIKLDDYNFYSEVYKKIK